MKKINLLLMALVLASITQAQIAVSTFDDLILSTDSFWNGSDLSGGFHDGAAFFRNSYDTSYGGYWSDGFVYSNVTDSTDPDYTDLYTAVTRAGYNGSYNYAVGNDAGNAKVVLNDTAKGKLINGFYVTNSLYAYLGMKSGDGLAKKFGGVTGTDPDWFKLTIKGWSNGAQVNDSVDFYLADYRFMDTTQDYIVKDWRWVNLESLGNVDSIQFFLSSSDTGQYGINTPAYFCIDNFTCNQVNYSPVTADDYFTITYGQDTLLNVTANDFDTTGTPLTVSILSGPLIPGASAVGQGSGIFYTPAIGIVAVDTIIYSACDAGNLCDTATVIINVTAVAGVKDLIATGVNVFPNPFASSFTIQFNQPVERYVIYDLQGSELKSVTSRTGEEKVTVNAADLPAGTYFIRLVSGEETLITRIVKQ